MSEIILTSGSFHKYVSGSSSARSTIAKGGYSLTTGVDKCSNRVNLFSIN